MYANLPRPDEDLLGLRPERRVVVDRTLVRQSQTPDLYEIAYDEAKELIKTQAGRLDDQRTRATQFATLTIAATSLLVAFGAKAATRDALFYVLATFATVCSLLMLASLVLLLLPGRSRGLTTSLSGSLLVDQWIETDGPPPSKAEFIRGLIKVLGETALGNQTRLQLTQRLYASTVVTGGLSIVMWAIVVWARS